MSYIFNIRSHSNMKLLFQRTPLVSLVHKIGSSHFWLLFIAIVPPIELKSKHRNPHPFSENVWHDSLDMCDIEIRLLTEPISEIMKLSHFQADQGKRVQGDSAIRILRLNSGILAVFKPGQYRFAEVAAYRASKALGQKLVPPTVLRTIEGREGSVQFYVYSPYDLKNMHNPKLLFEKISAKTMSDVHLFYYIFGQWDVHQGNQIITPYEGKYYMALIDNAGLLHRSFTPYGNYSFIERGSKSTSLLSSYTNFPYSQVQTVKPQSAHELRTVFGEYVPEKTITKLWASRRPISYCIWCDTLWIRRDARSSIFKPKKAQLYYASTLKAYESLTKETLESMWAEWLVVEPHHAQDLIALTLERRSLMLSYAYSAGSLVNDIP